MMSGIYRSVIEAIGSTPLVSLDRLTAGLEGRILAKLEYLNPGFSKKDRAALRIIDEAERTSALHPGQTVVEMTSGNMGTGLSIVCAIRGYPFVAVMSSGNSTERARMMRALDAEVVLVDQCEGGIVGQVSGRDLELVEQAARRITAERGAFRADQFALAGNWLSHYDGTGQELWAQSGGAIDAFVDFVGSGGTFAGVTRALKDRNPGIRCFIVEPTEAAVLAGLSSSGIDHPIQGGGYSMSKLTQIQGVPIDGYIQVSGEQARDMARRLASVEGIFGGYSTGANVAAALQLLRGELSGASIAVIACDSGLKYLSTDLWE
jgi:cysteine synthase A